MVVAPRLFHELTSTDNGATWNFEATLSGAQNAADRDPLGGSQPDLAIQGSGLRHLAQ
jgi:hypothetical protein